MPITLELRSNGPDRDVVELGPMEEHRRSEHVVAADHRHHAARLAVGS
jgi:hypothetical protein